MCGCGRKRTSVVTTAQVEADETRRAMETLEQQTISAAEGMLKSAANAASNARS